MNNENNTILSLEEAKKLAIIEGKRVGRKFEENGMGIYDVEVLSIDIDDENISNMLINNQHDIVRQNLNILKLEKTLQFTKKNEEILREELTEKLKTTEKNTEVKLKILAGEKSLDDASLINKLELKKKELDSNLASQEVLDKISEAELSRKKAAEDLEIDAERERSLIFINETEKELAAIQPGLIEAAITASNFKLADTLAKNLKSQTNNTGFLSLFQKGGGFDEILETIKGSPLEERFRKLQDDYTKFKESKKI